MAIIALMKEPFKWDNYSDQPAIITDKNYKKTMRKREIKSLVKTIFTALIILPISLVAMPFVKRKHIKSNDFFSLGVDVEREKEQTLELIEELEVKNILLRLKLWEMEKLDELKEFLELQKDKKIILKSVSQAKAPGKISKAR